MRAFRYFLDEALASLWRGRQSGLLSIATITTAVFVLGAVLLVTSNVERLLGRWSGAAEFSVYLRDAVTPVQRAAIERVLAASGLVAGREAISKSEAVRRFKRDFPDLADATEGLADNPLPSSIEVRLKPGAAAGAEVTRLADQLRQTAGVGDVRYDRRWIERLLAAVTLVRSVGLVIASILVVAAALTVANVIRLALFARRDEIHIMQLVGAPMAYIRGPFVVEGILQGGCGALVAMALLRAAFDLGRARYGATLAGVVDASFVGFLPLQLCLLLLVGGMAVGGIGGLVAARTAR